MKRLRSIQFLIAVLSITVGVVLFFTIVPTTGTDTGQIGGTIIAVPGLPGFAAKPSYNSNLPALKSTIPAVVVAAKSDLARTGAWAKEWFGPSDNTALDLQLETNVLPTVTSAKAVQTQFAAKALSKATFTAAKQSYTGTISIAPLDGSGVAYVIPPVQRAKTATTAAVNTPAEPGVQLVFRVGRTVVAESLSGVKNTKAAALAVAKRETALLDTVVPALRPFVYKHDPTGSTVIFVVVGAAIVLLATLVPAGVAAGKRRRIAEVAARADQHRRVRGAKALKSQRRRF